MTDKEKLLALMSSFGLTPTPSDYAPVVYEAKKGNVQGYDGFAACFFFHEDGSFDQLRIEE